MLGSRYLTKDGDPDKARQLAVSVPGMAHLASTGPPGTTCGDCVHWQPARNGAAKQCCLKYRAMMPLDKAVHYIRKNQPSCRYWEKEGVATNAR
jgi:hypothetical protein